MTSRLALLASLLALAAFARSETVLFADDFSDRALPPATWPLQKNPGGAIAVVDDEDGKPALQISPPPAGELASLSSTTFKSDARKVRISWEESISETDQGGMMVALSDVDRYLLLIRQTRFGDYRRQTAEPGPLQKVATLNTGWVPVSLVVDRDAGAVEMFYGDPDNATALFELNDKPDSFQDVRLIIGTDASTTQPARLRNIKVEAIE